MDKISKKTLEKRTKILLYNWKCGILYVAEAQNSLNKRE